MSNLNGGNFIHQESYRTIEQLDLDLKDRFILLVQSIQISAQEKKVVEKHEFTPATISITFKDLLRIRVEKILSMLLVKFGLSNISINQLLELLSNERFIQAKLIVHELLDILDNWEEIAESGEDTFRKKVVIEVGAEVNDMFRENVSTFLGENMSFRPDLINKFDIPLSTKAELLSLIQENKLTKIRFGYNSDYKMMEYLISRAIRCLEQTNGEREAVELANQLFLAWNKYFSKLPLEDRNRFLNIFRLTLAKYPKILDLLNNLENTVINPDNVLIEISPPLYRPMQKNVMIRVFIANEDGYEVQIFSLPYVANEITQLLGIVKKRYNHKFHTTYESTQLENLELSSFIEVGKLDIDSIIANFPLINKYSNEAIAMNEKIVDTEISELTNRMEPFMNQSINNLTNIVLYDDLLETYSTKYVDLIKAMFFRSSDNVDSEDLGAEELSLFGEEAFNKVMNGATFDSVVSSASESISYNINASGPCVVFQDSQATQSQNTATNNSGFTFPTAIGQTVSNSESKFGIKLETKTTKVGEESYKTIMKCPVCKKGEFEIKAECDMTQADKEAKCPVCNKNIQEMKKWYEIKDSKAMVNLFREARREYQLANNLKLDPDLDKPSWADHLISFLSFGLLSVENVAEF